MVFEGIPGGPMDCWSDVKTPAGAHLAKSKWILDTFLPWEAERCRDDRTDRRQRHSRRRVRADGAQADRPASVGRARVRARRRRLPQRSDHRPGLEQRLESARRSISTRSSRRASRPFDAAFMQATFDKYWGYAQYVTGWTNALLQPPPPHVLNIMGAAQRHSGARAGGSPTASTTRSTSSRGSPCPRRPRSISSRWRREAAASGGD